MKIGPQSLLYLTLMSGCAPEVLTNVPCTDADTEFLEATGSFTSLLATTLDGRDLDEQVPQSSHGAVDKEGRRLREFFEEGAVYCAIDNPENPLDAAGTHSTREEEIQINVEPETYIESRDEDFDEESMILLVDMIREIKSENSEKLPINEFGWVLTRRLIDHLIAEDYVANESEAAAYIQQNIFPQFFATADLGVTMIHEAAHDIHLLEGDEVDIHNTISGHNKCINDVMYGAGAYFSNVLTLLFSSMHSYLKAYHLDSIDRYQEGVDHSDAACEVPSEWGGHYVDPEA